MHAKTDKFKLESSYTPAGDQPEAIVGLKTGIKRGDKEQVLLGVTGSGKTFTVANVIADLQLPTLVISHNKTLAAQLYQEFKEFFPNNAVSYFVSYYDYYQPEAYVPQTDTYIEKETEINEEIDKLRLAATTNILTRKDTIVVASVSCIYNIGSPKEYGQFVLELKTGVRISREQIIERLVALQYERSDFGFHRSTFRVRGETIDLFPAYEEEALRITLSDKEVQTLSKIDPLTGKIATELNAYVVYPAKHYMTDPRGYKEVFGQITADMEEQVKYFTKIGKVVEAFRIRQRVEHDLEMIAELGYVNGIENYSRYFDKRKPGDAPFTLFDYFPDAYGDKWLLVIDESHMSMAQVRGMYNGDRARKQTLIDYGFRLPAALDNRPLKFDEFLRRMPATIYVSATPSEWEIVRARSSAVKFDKLDKSGQFGVIEQLVRPTGLVDPEVLIRPVTNQIQDLTKEILQRVKKRERVLVTTLTKQMAEDLTKHLAELGVKVQYLHSDVETLTRTDILTDLRLGTFDVIVGVNLLREGLDLPEVALVAILDADKEGFLRSRTSLIQTMGRAARHINGQVILYADKKTDSIKSAMTEANRRRQRQLEFNKKHRITPRSIIKPVRERFTRHQDNENNFGGDSILNAEKLNELTPMDREKYVKRLVQEMKRASKNLQFELAAQIRDEIKRLKTLD